MNSFESLGNNYLITTDNWFFAPDGKQYKAVWGTINSINDSKETLGIKTNAKSTNWYISIGNMILAGCQIHYAIRTDEVSFSGGEQFEIEDGQVKLYEIPNNIYNANQ